MRRYLNGNEAIAEAVKLADVEVVAAYPITPQSTIVEKIADFLAKGEMDADYIRAESEHSALAASYGAATTGVRVFTATSSQGLAFMFEMLHYVSGCRIPLVMAVANRGLAAPWTIWADHQDSISCRDTGWIQLYVETAQEALDTCLMAYKIATDENVLTPVMVCLDGYVLSHTEEVVEVPSKEEVKMFLPPHRIPKKVDINEPYVFGVGAGPEVYSLYKESQQEGILNAKRVISEIDQEFGAKFGRSYNGGLVDPYRTEEAEVILVALGAVCGTAREVVDKMRNEGKKVGLLRLKSFRPFPAPEIQNALKNTKTIAVLDRDLSPGCEGALATEVKAAFAGLEHPPQIKGFIGGLGGRDLRKDDLEQIFEMCLHHQAYGINWQK